MCVAFKRCFNYQPLVEVSDEHRCAAVLNHVCFISLHVFGGNWI